MSKICVIFLSSFLLMACEGFSTKTIGGTGGAGFGSSGTPGPIGPVDGVRLIAVQNIADMNLSTEQKIKFQVTSANGYAGTVALNIDRAALDLIDTQKAVELSLSNQEVTLTAGSSTEIELTVKTKSSAPSFDLTDFKITAVPTDERSNPTEISLQVKVNAVVELRMLGRQNLPEDRFNQPSDMDFAVHQQGLRIRYINMDQTEGHIIHGNGSIPHGDRDNPLAASVDGIQNGGVYEVIISPIEDAVGTYYYHNFEGMGQRRSMRFNQTPAQLVQVTGLRSVASLTGVDSIPELEADKGEHSNCHGGK